MRYCRFTGIQGLSSARRLARAFRQFAIAAVIAIIVLVSADFLPSIAAESSPKPNIIFILTDDQGYGDLGRHGHPLLKTPHTDRLHDESVRFDNFYVSPSCSPTRAALMTGMHEFRNGVTHTILPREHLYKDALILPQLLKTAGYRTCFIGKWHLGGGKGYPPNERGFDWTATNPQGPRKHFDPEIIRNGKRTKRKGYREDLFFDEAMAFIDETTRSTDSGQAGTPFFCYLATYSPHTPLAAPEEFIAPFRGKVTDEQATYLGMVANIDYNVGRLLEFLKDRELEKDTILLFMNDNGETKGLDVYNAGMRGCKCTIWEGGCRAMSFWRWPGHWQPHKVDNLTAHLDILPTLCELAGVKIPATLQPKLEGFSLLPLLEAKKPLSWHDDRMLFHHVARWPSGMAASHKYAMCAVRQGNHLLLRSRPCDNPECTPQVHGNQCHTLRSVEKGATSMIYTEKNAQLHWGASPANRWVLFDVKKDPACQDDLASTKPELATVMAAAYEKWWDDVYPDMIARGGDKGESDPGTQPPVNYKQEKTPKAPTAPSAVSANRVSTIEPTWESLAANYHVPDWFVDGKLGVWFHWGIPSSVKDGRPHDGSHYGAWMYGTEGQLSASKYPEAVQQLTDWHDKTYGPHAEFGYEDLIPLFKAEKWDPDALVKVVKDVGARFIMPVACHHDNFDMYDSSHPWNSVDMGPRRDTLKEWKVAARKHGVKFGISTHLYWSPRFFNSARPFQKEGSPAWSLFNMDYDPKGYSRQDSWNQHWYARCWEIIEKYDPDMFNNDSPYPTLQSGKGLGIKLFTGYVNKDLKENNEKQDVVLSFKNASQNKKAFTYNMERGSAAEIEPEPWMWATDLSGTWYYRDGARNRMSIPVMIGNAIDSISKNGVVMLNIALKGDGTIPDNQMEYLNAFRGLMRVNGEGIYGSRPWKVFGEGPLVIKAGRGSENLKAYCQEDVRFTTKEGKLYAFVLAPPTSDILIKTLRTGGPYDGDIESVTILGSNETVKWNRSTDGLTIKLPTTLPAQPVIGFRISRE